MGKRIGIEKIEKIRPKTGTELVHLWANHKSESGILEKSGQGFRAENGMLTYQDDGIAWIIQGGAKDGHDPVVYCVLDPHQNAAGVTALGTVKCSLAQPVNRCQCHSGERSNGLPKLPAKSAMMPERRQWSASRSAQHAKKVAANISVVMELAVRNFSAYQLSGPSTNREDWAGFLQGFSADILGCQDPKWFREVWQSGQVAEDKASAAEKRERAKKANAEYAARLLRNEIIAKASDLTRAGIALSYAPLMPKILETIQAEFLAKLPNRAKGLRIFGEKEVVARQLGFEESLDYHWDKGTLGDREPQSGDRYRSEMDCRTIAREMAETLAEKFPKIPPPESFEEFLKKSLGECQFEMIKDGFDWKEAWKICAEIGGNGYYNGIGVSTARNMAARYSGSDVVEFLIGASIVWNAVSGLVKSVWIQYGQPEDLTDDSAPEEGKKETASWDKFADEAKGLTLVRPSRDGAEIATNRGASIPIAHGRRLYRLAKRVKESGVAWTPSQAQTDRSFGHYKLDSIDAQGNVTIGCHYLDFRVLEHAANKLKVELEDTPIPSDCDNAVAV